MSEVVDGEDRAGEDRRAERMRRWRADVNGEEGVCSAVSKGGVSRPVGSRVAGCPRDGRCAQGGAESFPKSVAIRGLAERRRFLAVSVRPSSVDLPSLWSSLPRHTTTLSENVLITRPARSQTRCEHPHLSLLAPSKDEGGANPRMHYSAQLLAPC